MIEKKKIHLTVIPSYKRCKDSLLYYFNEESDEVLDLTKLTTRLEELDRNVIIDKIDIKPSDISALSDTYFDLLYHLCLTATMKVSVWTWLLNFSKPLINDCDMLNVSYNFYFATDEIKKKVAKNIEAVQSNGKIINLKTPSQDIREQDPKKIIEEINKLGVKSWEILPCADGYENTEEVVKDYLKLSNKMNFAFQNKLQLDGVLLGENYNTNKVFILPNGNYGIMIFSDNCYGQREVRIGEIQDIYQLNYELGKLDGKRSSYCKDCNFKLMCLANHWQDFDYTGKSCCGFRDLISEYRGVKKK